jgi:DnaK suppressor protein
MQPVGPEDAAFYRHKLTQRKSQLLAGIGPRFDSAAKTEHFDDDDQAQVWHDEFVLVRLNGLDYVQLRLIEEALDRIASGHYGICLHCDSPIPAKRLHALPWARYCVPCQEEIGAQQEDAMLQGQTRTAMESH